MKSVTRTLCALAFALAVTVAGGIFPVLHGAAQAPAKPRIKFVTTGGTIANYTNPDGTHTRILISDVFKNIRARFPQPEVTSILDSIEFSEVETTRVNSGSQSLTDYLSSSLEAQKAIDAGFDAVIVTHGTVTSEDTAYFLNLLVSGDAPVVLVNSQIDHYSVGNDGDMNLINAIMVASSKSSRGKAVLVENQKILAAREVVKGSDLPGGFSAGALGPLGWIARPDDSVGPYTTAKADQFVTYYRDTVKKGRGTSEFNIKNLVLPNGSFKPLPRVEILAGHYDGRVDVIDALVKVGAEGLVITGMPPFGGVFGPQGARLNELANGGMPIVHTSRNAPLFQNRVYTSGNNHIEGNNLPWQKARILLQLAMQKTAEQGLKGNARLAEIQRIFETH